MAANNGIEELVNLLRLVTRGSGSGSGSADGWRELLPRLAGETALAAGKTIAAPVALLGTQVEQLVRARPGGAGSAESAPSGFAAESGGWKETAAPVGRAVASSLGGGLSALPLFRGLISLFGRQAEAPPALAPYVMPTAVRLEAGISKAAGSSYFLVDRDQGGQARPVLERPAGAAPAQAVTVQVQAMDARSFLDHSEEIARAVREALLNSHALGDVLGEM